MTACLKSVWRTVRLWPKKRTWRGRSSARIGLALTHWDIALIEAAVAYADFAARRVIVTDKGPFFLLR